MKTSEQKTALRTRMRTVLQSRNAEARRAAVDAVCQRLRDEILPRAKRLIFYAPLADEIDIWPALLAALETGKHVALPRFDSVAGEYEVRRVEQLVRDTVVGQFGIREPCPDCAQLDPAVADWVLVPGLAFDLRGYRLGRGKGYYDRLLLKVEASRCGVAFDEQIFSELPQETHDLMMDALVTPTRWINLPSRSSPSRQP